MFVACQIVNDYLKVCLLNHELMDCCMSAGVLFWSQGPSFWRALLEAPGFVFCGQAWETNRRLFQFVYKNLELVSTAVVIEN